MFDGRKIGQCKTEYRTVTRFGLYLDRPPHEFDKAFADRESEPGASVSPTYGVVGLNKTVKNKIELTLVDAGSGILQAKLQFIVLQPATQLDPAAGGKFYRVGK